MKSHTFFLLFCLLVSVNSGFSQEVNTAQKVSPQEEVNFYLLRGLGRESGHWGNTFMDQVKETYPEATFTLLDLPGAGAFHYQSAQISIEGMSAFLQQEYQESLQNTSGKNILLATSLSGNVALEWVLHHPDNFQGLVLVGTSLKKVCKKKERVQKSAKKEFFDIFMTADVTEREQKFLSINSNLYAENDSILQRWIDIQEKRPISKTTLFKQTMAGMFYLTPNTKPAIPILVVGSEGDKIVNPVCIQKVQTHLEADLAMHEYAGHGIPIDAPVWLADQLTHWADDKVVGIDDTYTEGFVYEDEVGLNDILKFSWLGEGITSALKGSGRAVKNTVELAGL